MQLPTKHKQHRNELKGDPPIPHYFDTYNQLTNDIPVLVRLSKVRIFPNAVVHKKNETLLGTLIDQMPFQGKGTVEAPRISPVKGRLFKSGLRKINCMTFILFSLRCAIGWLFHCLTTTASILKITILTGKYLGWKYCAKYSSRSFSFMSSQPVIAGLCFIKWRRSRFSKKIFTPPINFNFANLTFLLSAKLIHKKNCSISFNQSTKSHGRLWSLRPSKQSIYEVTIVH